MGRTGSKAGQVEPVDDIAQIMRQRAMCLARAAAIVGVLIEVELPRDPAAASHARRLLDELSADRLQADALDRSKLLVSELVNNAVLHGRGRITLRVDVNEARLRAEVIDEGSGFERVVRDNPLDQLGGWGLALVDSESSRWGVHEGTTHVWFEIEQPGPNDARSLPSCGGAA